MTLPDKLKSNLLLFCKIIGGNKIFWAKFSDVHKEISELLMGENRRLNIILPRGFGKTTLISQYYSLFHLFAMGGKCVVIVSKTQAHSINCLTAIKDILDYSMEFRSIYGYWGAYSAKTWRNDMIILKNGSVIIAKGMGQPIRGLNFNGIRPDLMLLDDPEDENNTKTPEAMSNNMDWVLKAAEPALDVRHGKFVVVGTPIHQRCIVETLNGYTSWKTVRYSYLYEDEGEEKSIWEEVLSADTLKTMRDEARANGKLSVFYAERMCQIVGDESQLFREEYLKYFQGSLVIQGNDKFLKVYQEDGVTYLEPKIIPVNVFMGVDPASSTKSTADYSVIFPIAYDYSRNIYCLPYYRARVSPMVLADKIVDMWKTNSPNKTKIESVGYQEMLRDYLRSKHTIPGLEVKESPRNSKSARLESLEPHFAGRKVWVMKDMHSEFINELLTFPKSKNDDIMDAFYYALRGCYVPTHSRKDIKAKKKSKKRKEEVEGWMIA